ncbi:MAG: hypothetical protein JWN69_390 [Alphaproteobacteria bacterium]|nr:hypothetical protein [Alphaproteobacteria bacterium]
MPDLSIIIPTFNRLWALPDAVASCRGAAASVQIIVVDDGSTDGTWEWLQRQKDVESFRQPNQGKDWAVNNGFRHATGEFVRFLDSDDMIADGANDRQLAVARSAQADVVAGGRINWDERTGEKQAIEWLACDDFVAQQLEECDSSHYSAYLFRRDFIASIPHRQEYGRVDDRMFVLEVALANPRLAFVPAPCLIHRHHGCARLQSETGFQASVSNWQYVRIFENAARTLEARGELSLRRRKAIATILWPVAHSLARVDLDEGSRVADWLVRLDPEILARRRGIAGAVYRRFGFRRARRLAHALRPLRRLVVGKQVGRSPAH